MLLTVLNLDEKLLNVRSKHCYPAEGGLIICWLTRLAYQLIFGLHELTRREYESRHFFKTY
ncbi:hypothetical protein C8R31_106194 [Nitrosospira sp. Nsp2]|nr:hypothetical protein C8R31_106194 [Nitrosospira sp. Nsp2]